MKNLEFLNFPQSYQPDNAFVVHISGVHNKRELLTKLSQKLLFPNYFGFNWDAVWDVLCDFEWIEDYHIVLIHDDLPALEKEDLRIYLQILDDAVEEWRAWNGEKRHNLEVVFSADSKELITELS